MESLIFGAAKTALSLGLSVIPPAEDGTKRPLPDPTGRWEDYMERRATAEQLERWYGPRTGVGLVCGAVSGGLELFEFDDHATYEAFVKAARALGETDLIEAIEFGYLEETPGGGIHWLYRCDEVRGSTKLATRKTERDGKKTVKTLIETKGEGGFVVIAPSYGNVHPSHNPYRLVSGGLESIIDITADEREWLWQLARDFHEDPDAAKPAPDTHAANKGGTGDWADTVSPGADFNARATWDEVLPGWTLCYRHGQTEYWRRPDKNIGHSATVNHNGTDRLHVFTSSSEFEPGESYSKFGAFARLEHRGDHSAAARALYEAGYGTHKRWVKDGLKWALRTFQNPHPKGEKIARPGEPPPGAAEPAVPASNFEDLSDEELGLTAADTIDPEPILWLWPNHVAKGKINLIAGEGGEGKSQITIGIIAAVTRGGLFPDGSRPDETGKCLILAAEDGAKDTIVPRLIAAGADRKRVIVNSARVSMKDKNGKALIHPVSFQDLDYWQVVLKRHDVKLLIADPVPAYLGRGVNDHRNNEVRAVLEPFADLCNELGVAFVAVTHVSKSTDAKNPVHKILGSVAYYNLARTVHCTYRDPDDDKLIHFCLVKSNILAPQPSLAFRIEPVDFPHGGKLIKTSKVVFETGGANFDPTAHLAGQAKAKGPGRDPAVSLRNAEWLHDALWGNNWMPLVQLIDFAGEFGMLGERKPDGKWASINPLYRAKDRVNDLPEPKSGFVVDELRMPLRGDGKNLVHWKLVPDDAPAKPF